MVDGRPYGLLLTTHEVLVTVTLHIPPTPSLQVLVYRADRSRLVWDFLAKYEWRRPSRSSPAKLQAIVSRTLHAYRHRTDPKVFHLSAGAPYGLWNTCALAVCSDFPGVCVCLDDNL